MALVAQPEEKKKGQPLVMQAAALLAVTALAAGMGWLTGGYLEERSASTQPENAASGGAMPAESETGEADGEAAPSSIVTLDPITTNLAEPTNIWVRTELAVVFEGEADPVLARAIHQDLFAYIRTVKLKQIESASGFQHLKSDLLERARIRSESRVKEILITSFLYE